VWLRVTDPATNGKLDHFAKRSMPLASFLADFSQRNPADANW
jgi:hypothetical protein